MTRISSGRMIGLVVAVLLGVLLYRALGVGQADPSPVPASEVTPGAASTATPASGESGAVGADATAGPTAEATGSAPPPSEPPGPQAGGIVVPVVGVVDGDTLRVRVDGVTERLRLIGLDAPELSGGECLAQEAASPNIMLSGTQIAATKSVSRIAERACGSVKLAP